MSEYGSYDDYKKEIKNRTVLPEGFTAGTVPLTFMPKERANVGPLRMELSGIVLKEPTQVFGGVFTKNKAPGAPVLIGKEMLQRPYSLGVIINNKISNVCAPGGKNSALRVINAFADAAGLSARNEWAETALFPSSTGIIGWGLPVDEMTRAAADLAKKIVLGDGSADGWGLLPVAEGIMTTDSFPKVRSAVCGESRIAAVGKGAGMIEPNMATMLIFVLTDADISRRFFRDAIQRVVDRTFNNISVDGDQSTSDTLLGFSSCRKPCPGKEEFENQLLSVCGKLAEDIVRNGEGTGHVIQVTVSGAQSDAAARGFGKAVVNSPLVKTAVFGNDPNIGRIIMALGDYAGNADVPFYPETAEISIGGVPVFRDGAFMLNEEKEVMINNYLKSASMAEKKQFPPHEKNVEIYINLHTGNGTASILGSDFSYEYVRENADYRT